MRFIANLCMQNVEQFLMAVMYAYVFFGMHLDPERKGAGFPHQLHVSSSICCGQCIRRVNVGYFVVPSLCQRLLDHVCQTAAGNRSSTGKRISHFGKPEKTVEIEKDVVIFVPLLVKLLQMVNRVLCKDFDKVENNLILDGFSSFCQREYLGQE